MCIIYVYSYLNRLSEFVQFQSGSKKKKKSAKASSLGKSKGETSALFIIMHHTNTSQSGGLTYSRPGGDTRLKRARPCGPITDLGAS